MTASATNAKTYHLEHVYGPEGKAPEVLSVGDANQLTLPDVHGNVLGAMLRLEAYGILKVQDEDRERIAAIYQKGGNLTDDEFEEFDLILSRATFNNTQITDIRFIGDVLGDRGQNDILMLCLLSRLKQSHFKVKINFSNHDVKFISWYLQKTTEIACESPDFAINQNRSFTNFIAFLERRKVAKNLSDILDERVDTLIQSYLSIVELVQCDVDTLKEPHGLVLYNHAPVGKEAVEGLCEWVGIPFDESSAESITKHTRDIDKRFHEILSNEPKTLAEQLKKELKSNKTNFSARDAPLYYIACNQDEKKIQAPKSKNFTLEVNHGHAGTGRSFYGEEFKASWEFNGVRGNNLDYNNLLGRSAPTSDADHSLGIPGSLNCRLSMSEGKLLLTRLLKEINLHLTDWQKAEHAYWILLDKTNVRVIEEAKKEVTENPGCHKDIKKLVFYARELKDRIPSYISENEEKYKDIRKVILAFKACLYPSDNNHSFQGAYRLAQNQKALIDFAKKTFEKENNPFIKNEMQTLIFLAREVENAAPSLWKRVLAGFAAGALVGGLAGTFIPVVGNAVGAFMGGISGTIATAISVSAAFGLAGLGSWVRRRYKNNRDKEMCEKVWNNAAGNAMLERIKYHMPDFKEISKAEPSQSAALIPVLRVGKAQISTSELTEEEGKFLVSPSPLAASRVKQPPSEKIVASAPKEPGSSGPAT